jgi:hypothetical protein
MSISPELAVELVKENGGWFGSPALLDRSPADAARSRDGILDGKVRFQALTTMPGLLDQWQAGKFPHLIFRSHTVDYQKQLPRLLALAGHYDRAYQHTPDHWRESPASLQAFLRLPRAEALLVFASRQRVRRSFAKHPPQRTDRAMGNREIVIHLRQLIITADETGEPLDLLTLRKVLFYGPQAIQRRTTEDTDLLFNDP